MSPRRFDRRTYIIVAPGWSALAFSAAMSASSASTTIRSAFPFTLSPIVNCHDIFGLPQSYLANERSPASTNTLRASSISLCLGVAASQHSARTPICTKIESGADAGLMGITCYMVRPTRASCIGISQQWRASLTDGNSVTPAQVTSMNVKDESINLTALAERQRIRLRATASGVPSELSRTRDVRCWHLADIQPIASRGLVSVEKRPCPLKADMPTQRVKCPLMTQSRHSSRGSA